MKTPEELTSLINNSPLFSIDRTRDSELFIAEERRFLDALAKLMELTRKDFKQTGVEIIETAIACIKAYKPDNGIFLNFFNTSLKKRVAAAKVKKKRDNLRTGLKISKKMDQTIRWVLKYAEMKGKNIGDMNFQNEVAEKLGMPLSVISEAINIKIITLVKSGNEKVAGTGDNENELFDFIAASAETAEEKLVSIDSIRETVTVIETTFKAQQKRTKPLLAKLLTARLIEALRDIQLIDQIKNGLTFFDGDIYSAYITDKKIPAARAIAQAAGVREESASRTLRTFVEKVSGKR